MTHSVPPTMPPTISRSAPQRGIALANLPLPLPLPLRPSASAQRAFAAEVARLAVGCLLVGAGAVFVVDGD